jgi:hypothetical protein
MFYWLVRLAANLCLIVPHADMPIEVTGYNPAMQIRKKNMRAWFNPMKQK